MFEFNYLRAMRTAGYSGFVLYWNVQGVPGVRSPSECTWLIPGTFFDDWDNR